MMGHEAGARAANREIRATLLHLAQLVRFDRLAQFVVADLELFDLGRLGGIRDPGDLPIAPRFERLGSGRVMTVAVDDHGPLLLEGERDALRPRRLTPWIGGRVSERIPGRPL